MPSSEFIRRFSLQNDNPAMTSIQRLTVLSLALAGAGCNPVFNWREAHPAQTALTAMLPCKPEQGSRQVLLAGEPVELQMLGCEAGGATFALGWATLKDAARTGPALTQWRAATLANVRASAPADSRLSVPGATDTALLTVAGGRRPGGGSVTSQAAYFSQGAQVFQAALYAERPDAEVVQTFFSGLRLK
jgi:hypothetical protein